MQNSFDSSGDPDRSTLGGMYADKFPGFDRDNPRAMVGLPGEVMQNPKRVPCSLSIPFKPILIVSDAISFRKQWTQAINEAQYQTYDCSCGHFITLSQRSAGEFSLVIVDTDNLAPAMGNHTRFFHDTYSQTPVIFVGSGHVKLIPLEDYPEYLIGCLFEFDKSTLLPLVHSGLQVYRTIQEKIAFSYSFGMPVIPIHFGLGALSIRRFQGNLETIAPQDVPVFIEAEPGIRADIAALQIHGLSNRRLAPFGGVRLNFGYRELYEPQLFGIEPQTHIHIPEGQIGLIELMSRGTVLIESFQCMLKPTQERLLSYLKTGVLYRVNAFESRMCDTRIIVTSTSSLEELGLEGSFSPELLEILSKNRLRIPSLREFPEILSEWITFFTAWISETVERPKPPEFTPEAVKKLTDHSWPGNTEEFFQVLRRLVHSREEVIDAEHIVFNDKSLHGSASLASFVGLTQEEMSKRFILETLRSQRGNRAATARMLDISEKTLYNKLRDYERDEC